MKMNLNNIIFDISTINNELIHIYIRLGELKMSYDPSLDKEEPEKEPLEIIDWDEWNEEYKKYDPIFNEDYDGF